ncbi:hypothetical protein Pelo_5553 [Pelomyxa schiedti]|nr:hypothetical protein Pelo_5553 [Pelomyxa schiedti]
MAGVLAVLLYLFGLAASNVPQVVSGPWYYIGDGYTSAHVFDPEPAWLLTQSGNTFSLAFLDPNDIAESSGVPEVFSNTSSLLNGLGKTVFYSIGGYAYADHWSWLSNIGDSTTAGVNAGTIAKKHGVGIEIDYEGWISPSTGVPAFIKGFRSVCPMTDCLLTMDLYGSPGGADWQKSLLPLVMPPTGIPGDLYGDGNWLDFVNVMVIDGQTVDTDKIYWQQWIDTKLLNMPRTTFALIAGYPGLGICKGDAYAISAIDTTISFFDPYSTYGILSWAVCPPAPGSLSSCGDWTSDCNEDAPGFLYLCQQLGSC